MVSSLDFKKHLQTFEQQLDDALESLPIRRWSSSSALRMASEMCEIAAFNGSASGISECYDRGFTILANHLTAGDDGYIADLSKGADIETLSEGLMFASHYYMVREYLYYSYNVPGSMAWSFDESRVEIRFGDRSVPRQFFTVHNDHLLGSQHHFRNFNHSEEVIHLLKNEPEGEITPNFEKAAPLMQAEADLKLEAYFSLLASDSQIDLGGYSYGQFLSVYRMLLTKALYHRYMARAQNAVGAIYMSEADLLDGVSQDLGIPSDIGQRILKDLVFDRDAPASRVDAALFSLSREGDSETKIVMRPHHFATAEGLVNMLRVIAQRRPRTFLDQVSSEMSDAFVQRVKKAWEAEGFTCFSELSLRDYDPLLPDIDLLVISCEPTLGYVIQVCELKCPIPPRWAKDQLKVLNKDSVSKAFRQVEALRVFLRTDAGLEFLKKLLPKEGHPYFEGFVVALDFLIITSDNSGMFFGDQSTHVVNFRTLERLLRRSDGDMALIQHVLRTYAEHADDTLVTTMVEFQIGSLTVAYEAVSQSPLLEFPEGSWRNSPDRQAMIDDFIAQGAHPFDSFEHRSPDVIVINESNLGTVVQKPLKT